MEARGVVVVLLSFVACGGPSASPTATTTPASPAPASPPPTSTCPADEAGPRLAPEFAFERCEASRSACEEACEEADGNACLVLAIIAEDDPRNQSHAQVLYRRACQLGALGGCTNVAAFLIRGASDPATTACAARTFQLTCAGDDAWGCVMLASALLNGSGIERDLAAARAAAERACPRAADAFVCDAAAQVTARIDAAER